MDMQKKWERSPLTLFYSYADQDENLCEELEKHLSILQRQRTIVGWHHHKILPGADKNQINDEQFSSAQIIILLISPDFLASDASHAEMERALQRHTAGLSSVIPLLLRPVDWQPSAFAHLQALPRNGIPVTKWENHDEAFADIAKGVRLAIEQWNSFSFKPLQPPPTSVFPSLFLCSARKDLPLLKRLEDDLQAYGMIKDHKVPQLGSPDEDEKEDIREVMSSASAVILVASPSTRRSRSIKQALHIAGMYQHTLYLFWMQGNHLREVMPTGYDHLPSIDARGERYPQALQELLQALGRRALFTSLQDSRSEQPISFLGAPRNPYKGLHAFHMEDAQDFFGRDRLIEELLENVQQLLAMDQQDQIAARLLTVLGPSGSGKSSVVMAGFLPKLKQGRISGSERWAYVGSMVPGKHPLEALSMILTPLFPERSLKSIREDLEDDSARGLHLLLTTYVKQTGMNVLLVIDQFEELFTQTATEDERQQFLDILLAAISELHGPLIAVLTLRADFYDRPLQYPELGQLIKLHQVIVFPMKMPDLRKVIEQPAQLPDVQLIFEEGLVGDLLFEVQGEIGALPLLQFTLDQLFQHQQERLLTLYTYHQIGGVKGALAQHAESTYQSLSSENHQRLVRALFLRLINPGTVEEDVTRRRVPLSELVVIDQEETARLAEVANAFTKARLLTANRVGEVSTIEVSHEVLIQAWIRLQDWLHEARDDMHLQQIISEDTAEWDQHGQPADRLYRGFQLTEALRWREANLPSLDEDRFLQASIKERLHSSRRTFLIGMIGVAGMAGTAFLATTLVGRDVKSLPLLIQPYIYNGHKNDVSSVAWSPNGNHIVSGSADTTVQVWDASNGSHQFTYIGHSGIIGLVSSVAWSLDGKRIVSGSWDTTVRALDASSGRYQFTCIGHIGHVSSVAWSPDSKRIVSGSWDKTVRVWDAGNGSHQFIYTGHNNYVISVAWSPDGKRIASASSDTTVQVWDAHNGRYQFTYTGHSGQVNGVAWSPDGKYIASASSDTTVQIWNASTGSHQLTYSCHAQDVESVVWSPDSKRIASASSDTTVQVWDAHSGRYQFTHTGHSGQVNGVAWSPDGKYIASGSSDTTVQIWNATSDRHQLTYIGHDNYVSSVAWSPDGKRIASGSSDTTVQVWDAHSGRRQFTCIGHIGLVSSVAWSPDSKRIASASSDTTVRVWDASSGSHQLTYTLHTSVVWSVAWSPNGKRIASASGHASWDASVDTSDDKTVQIWDAHSGSHQFTYIGHNNYVSSVAWSPDGKRIASGSDDKTVQVWDASSGHHLLTYTGHSNHVSSVAWSPDGKRIASGSGDIFEDTSGDKTVQVWDASSGHRLLTYTHHTNLVSSVAWSPDGKRIASGSDDKTMQVWDASSGHRQFTCTGHTNLVSSVAWSLDGKRIASGSGDKTVQVWDASS